MIRATLDIPMLKVAVHLFVGSRKEIDIATRKSPFKDILDLEDDVFAGRALYKGADFGIQLVEDQLDRGVLSHEVFHVTHRIWHYLGDTFSVHHNEPHAFLCEFITGWVYKQLKRGGVRVR